MNRAQRRAAARGRSTAVDRKSALDTFMPAKQFSLALAKHDLTMASEEDADELTLSPLINIERLSTGTLNDEGFIDLNEANVYAFCIGAKIHQHAANDATREIIAQAQPIFEEAAEALGEIGHRKMKIGRYVATGDQLNAIRESIRLYREVILVSEKGLIVQALIRAKELVDQKLMRVWRENERKAA